MSIGHYIEQIRHADTDDAAFAVVRAAYDAAVAKAITVEEYNALWLELSRRHDPDSRSGDDFSRGGPRSGCNWTGD